MGNDPRDALERAIKVLGGPAAAARALSLNRYQAVQQWRIYGVPAGRCPDIERETRARGAVVRCEELRPDIDWSVLRVTA